MTTEKSKSNRAEILLRGILGTVISTLAFGGWAARDYVDTQLASKVEVMVAALKADFVLDQQMAAIISQISYLERKGNKMTPSEVHQLNYLRDQLNTMRKVRSGK